MDVYSWTQDSLSRMITLYRCENSISTPEELHGLYASISQTCSDLAAVRIASLRSLELGATMHQSDKSLDVKAKRVTLDLAKYIEQCNPKKGLLPKLKSDVAAIQEEIKNANSTDLINSHDLQWVLTFAFRQLTQLPKRTIDPELVISSLTSYGMLNQQLPGHPMFKALAGWAQQL